MNCGTTQDTFLRENLDWLGKATNWAKFTAVASIGVVHKGHVHQVDEWWWWWWWCQRRPLPRTLGA